MSPSVCLHRVWLDEDGEESWKALSFLVDLPGIRPPPPEPPHRPWTAALDLHDLDYNPPAEERERKKPGFPYRSRLPVREVRRLLWERRARRAFRSLDFD